VTNTLRPSIERASLPLITKLSGLPRALPFLLMLTLLVSGLLVSGPVGFVLMGLLLALAMAVVQLFPRA
jgi:hypothetical protein